MRSPKQVFYAIIATDDALTDRKLIQTFCLVEQSLNVRPLVPASSGTTEMEASISNHFHLKSPGSSLPAHLPNAVDHKKHYVRTQVYSDSIRSGWLKKYILSWKR